MLFQLQPSIKEIDDAAERVHVIYKRLVKWMTEGKITLFDRRELLPVRYPNVVDNHIALVLGYEDGIDMALNWRDESAEVVGLLGGSNGWVIYQMLLARKGHV